MNTMKDEQYCLRWNDHRITLLKNFERLLQNSTSVDCTLAADGQYLKAHKVVLSACSPYLETVLNCDVEKHPIVFLKDMKFQELKAIMEYMYRGEVVIPHNQLGGLLLAAESLQIKGLGCGDKVPVNGSRCENVMQKTVPQPTPPPPPPPAQPPKQQHAPAVRITEHTRVQHEAPPQVVDLTDDRAPTPGIPVARAPLEPKRSMPQPTGRNKRMPAPERFVQGNIPSAATAQIEQGAASPQGLLPQASGSNTYVIQNAFPVANVTPVVAAAAAAVVAAAATPKLSFVVQKLPANPGQLNDVAAPQVASPTHFESQNAGVSGIQPRIIYKQRVRKPLAQSTPIRSDALRAKQVGRPPILSPQHASAVGGTTVAVTPEQTPPNRVLEASGAVEYADKSAKVSTQQRSEIEKVDVETNAALARDCEQPQIPPPAPAPVTEPEGGPNALTAQDASVDEEAPANTAGPAEPERAKPAAGGGPRRGRPPAGERRFQCPECDKKFSNKPNLERHQRVHQGDCFNCDVCDKSFLARAGLVKHMRQHTAAGLTVSPQTGAKAAQAVHRCQLCGTVCSTASELEKHLTDHSLSATDNSEDLMVAE